MRKYIRSYFLFNDLSSGFFLWRVLTVSVFFYFCIAFQTSSYAQTLGYNMCRHTLDVPEKNTFCPRIEGQHPEGCCPPISGPSKMCYYAAYNAAGQGVLVNSHYYTCENDVNVRQNCCRRSSQACYEDRREKRFISFLVYQWKSPQGCCLLDCPQASYWPDIPDHYQRFGGGFPSGMKWCTSTPINNCDYTEACPGHSKRCSPPALPRPPPALPRPPPALPRPPPALPRPPPGPPSPPWGES